MPTILIIALLELQLAATKLQLAIANPDPVIVQDAQAFANAKIAEATQDLADYEASLATPTSTPEIAATSTQSNPTLGAVQNQPIQTTTPMPEVQKFISIEIGPYPVIYAFYSEDGVLKSNVQLNLSADDNGKITSSGSPDKYKLADNSQLTHPNVGIDGKIGAMFEYQPNATGTRTITIQGNGVSQSIQVPGAPEN